MSYSLYIINQPELYKFTIALLKKILTLLQVGNLNLRMSYHTLLVQAVKEKRCDDQKN